MLHHTRIDILLDGLLMSFFLHVRENLWAHSDQNDERETSSSQSDWNRRHMAKRERERECRRFVADGADGGNRGCMARKSMHIDVNSSVANACEMNVIFLSGRVCLEFLHIKMLSLKRRRIMMSLVTLLIWSLDLQIGETKRTRTSYSRYQTLELEKEFHFNR